MIQRFIPLKGLFRRLLMHFCIFLRFAAPDQKEQDNKSDRGNDRKHKNNILPDHIRQRMAAFNEGV